MEVWIMIIAMFALMYFLMIRRRTSGRKRPRTCGTLWLWGRDHHHRRHHGTICAVKENTIVIESGADRVRVELTKWAVSTKNAQGAEPATK